MRLVVTTNKSSYILSLVSMNVKEHIKSQIKFSKFLRKEDLITYEQMKNAQNSLKKAELHCIHSMLQVQEYDYSTNKMQEYRFPITTSPNQVIILKSLSESLLGENPEYYNVIKITDGLYMASHSLIIDLLNNKSLNVEELQYDKDKDYYVDNRKKF
jgi:hypothetical protein